MSATPQAQAPVSMRVGCAHLTVAMQSTPAQRKTDLEQLVKYINVHIGFLKLDLAAERAGQ